MEGKGLTSVSCVSPSGKFLETKKSLPAQLKKLKNYREITSESVGRLPDYSYIKV